MDEIGKMIEKLYINNYFIHYLVYQLSNHIKVVSKYEQTQIAEEFIVPFFACFEYLHESTNTYINKEKIEKLATLLSFT